MRLPNLAAGLFPLIGLAAIACAPVDTPASAAAGGETIFLCDGGTSIGVSFAGDDAVLRNGSDTATLLGQPAASGIHYRGAGHELRGKGPELDWTDPSGTTRACREEQWAMSQPQIQEPLASLDGTKWRLVQFQSSDDSIGIIVPPRVENYTMEFGPDGTLSLQLDCNRASSRWTAQPTSARGGSISFAPGAMTRAMCGEGALDSMIARDLEMLRSYTLADGRLHLALVADGGIYSWEPMP